jgi:catechol 2,3-dioxygenase-like lactoylglutathione lyase family enzyme
MLAGMYRLSRVATQRLACSPKAQLLSSYGSIGEKVSQRVFPQLRITNWKRTHQFYVDGLGFSVDWEHRFEPGFPVFAQLTREGLSLFLTEHSGDCQVGGAAYFVVDDVDALHAEIRSRGLQPKETPANTPWGTREMTILDPDGNRLRFANPVPS